MNAMSVLDTVTYCRRIIRPRSRHQECRQLAATVDPLTSDHLLGRVLVGVSITGPDRMGSTRTIAQHLIASASNR